MHPLQTRAWLEVNLDNLIHNYKAIEASLTLGSELMAVVKADAYGFGDTVVAREYNKLGCRYFGVSNFFEGRNLRQSGIQGVILQLGYTTPQEAEALVEFDITQTVVSFSHAETMNAALEGTGKQLNVHIKLDTGMSRIGFSATDSAVVEQITEVFHMPNLKVKGIFTHFSVSDEANSESIAFTQLQFDRLQDIIKQVEAKGYTFQKKHACNSAGTLSRPEMHLNLVRPGSILYGLAQEDEMSKDRLPIKGIVTLKTRVSLVKEIQKGDTVSYGRLFCAEKTTKVATVTLGYADGYSRVMTGKGWANVKGQRAKILGRICMDQIVLDISGIDVAVGDEIVFIADDGVAPTTHQYATLIHTIDTEIGPQFGKRLPRVYTKKGEIVETKTYC